MLNKIISTKIKRALTVGEFNELILSLRTDPTQTIQVLVDPTPDPIEDFIDGVKETLDVLYDEYGAASVIDENILNNNASFDVRTEKLAALPHEQIKLILLELSNTNLHEDGAFIADSLIYSLKKKMPASDFFALANDREIRHLF